MDYNSRARADFERARSRAFFGEILNKIFKKDNRLFRFDEVKYLLSPEGMAYRGVHPIPLKKIVGSEGRYEDFDKDFLPLRDTTRSRWEGIEVASLRDVHIPPILVYKIGDFYFVRDGNHRVSVAKELGQEFIDAEIVELFTKVKPKKINKKELLLAESYKYFLDKTHFDKIIPDVTIKLTNPWGYYRLIEHINTYKYFLSEKKKHEVSWEESVKRWYNELYLPVVRLINKRKVLSRFPDREAGDLYIWLMDHWHFLKERNKNIDIEEALEDYSNRFGKGFLGLLWARIKKKIKHFLFRSLNE